MTKSRDPSFHTQRLIRGTFEVKTVQKLNLLHIDHNITTQLAREKATRKRSALVMVGALLTVKVDRGHASDFC